MTRFVGIKNNSICMVSDNPFKHDDYLIIELPSSVDDISPSELILDFKYKDGVFINKKEKKSRKQLKVALIGNHAMECGIATYNAKLWEALIKQIGDYRLLIENVSNPVVPLHSLGDLPLDPSKVIQCWSRGESLNQLVDEIKKFDPDIVLIGHEFGLWSNARAWLSFMSRISEYRIITTMHSVFHHKDKTIVEAAMPEIVVHLEGAKDVLKKEKQIPGKVYVIPHGCDPCESKEKLWNFYKSDHTIVQFGFLFHYKNWEGALETVAILKQKYPDVFFTGLCSESPFNKISHQLYFNKLTDLISKLKIEENVSLIRGFQSDETLDSYLRTNKVALFPYISEFRHEVFGSSGAGRLAFSKGIPVVSSSVNHFSDLPTIKANTPAEMAAEIDKLFSDNKLVEQQVNRQTQFLEEHSWDKMAEKYLLLFENNLIA